ncbi:alpha/beta fold hydrolase [Caballeronia ptereochthonis]|uniref:Alpha/beta hydrolase n=1 Tax=Caballeronia ptereochthonis TaxID=1777144 RepID=A0A158DEA8_9BURK|nr:alpha/beta fold hydrolase [Caballeronia ptereochthonis]SAK92606.1 alpha/beta hydrolase [Caballeronia ptereochthonis]
MRPVVFGNRFGWLHAGNGTRGVVLCNTYGHEYVWTYSGMRHLAETLSARGIWVLRFDYHGTGDSAGADCAPDQFASSVDDIEAAIEWFRNATGIGHLTLCGFRVGAAFALEAALRKPVDELVLLAPVASGRIYMRELSIVRKTWLEQLAPPLREMQQSDAPLNVLGQVYSHEFERSLEEIDLVASVKNAASVPARRALIMNARAGGKDPLREALAERGVEAEVRPFEDLIGFIQETAFNALPRAAFDEAVRWMAGSASQEPQEAPAVASAEPESWPDLTIETPEAIERPVSIGDEALFGILCEPRTGSARGSVFLIANTSASSRVGDSRLSVRIARELARRGVASLRFDARGRGDSPAAPGIVQSDTAFGRIYNAVATEDTACAARWLARQGYKSIFSLGVCSGAYHALKAALIEDSITGVVTVNIPTFKKPVDIAPDALRQSTRNSMAGYAFSMLDPQKWKAILRGEKHLTRVLRFVIGYMVTRARSRIVDMLRLDRLSQTPPELATEPGPIIRALDARHVKTVLVYGAYDAGMDLIAAHFGKGGARLSRFPSVRMEIFPDVDHSLFMTAGSAQVIALCENVAKETRAAVTDPMFPGREPVVL